MTTQDIKVGDRVRVTYEGAVREVFPSGNLSISTNALPYPVYTRAALVAEKIESPVKVGDRLDIDDDLSRLPIGAVTHCDYSGEVARKIDDNLYRITGHAAAEDGTYLDVPLTVLHVPTPQ